MGSIGQGIKACHLMAIIAVFSFCLFSIPVLNSCSFIVVTAAAEDTNSGALIIAEPSNSETSHEAQVEEDGVVTENEEIGDQHSNEMFQATSDWKPVKKGQKIAPGLHVRLNLQTGEQEAKLMDKPTKKENNEWYAGENMGTINTEKQRYTRDELKLALKDFKLEGSNNGKAEQEEVNNKFRSYDELKNVLKDMEMSVQTEAEIVTGLLDKLKEPSINVDDVKTILVDLEYFLHQLDNARLFCDLSGMQLMIKYMNNSEADVRTKALLTLGSALQSNSKVQVNAIENGVMQHLLRLISVDVSVPVKKKALYALSTLLRQFPFAQKKFLEVGGLTAVKSLFLDSHDELLKIKIITLLTDLVEENDLSSMNLVEASEKALQYSEVKMREALIKSGWCTQLASLLHQHSGHDNVEKIISAMTVLKNSCKDQFSSLRPTLLILSQQYSDLAKQDKEQGETDTFFDTIHANIKQLLKDITFKREDL